MRSRLTSGLFVATAVLVAAAMALAAYTGVRNGGLSSVRATWACGVFVCMLALVLAYAACWWLLMCKLERRGIKPGPAIRMFCLSWVGRYLPASIPHYAGRLAAAPAAGMSRSAVAASLAYENLLVLAVTGAGAAACLSIAAMTGGASVMGVAAGVLLAVACASALHPRFINLLIGMVSRFVPRIDSVRGHVLPYRSLVPVLCSHATGFVCAGAAYYLAFRAIGESPPPLLAFAAYNLAGAAGMLAIGVPGGLGVREAVVVAIMSVSVDPADALAAAVLVRVVSIAADAVPALAALSWTVVAQRSAVAPIARSRRKTA